MERGIVGDSQRVLNRCFGPWRAKMQPAVLAGCGELLVSRLPPNVRVVVLRLSRHCLHRSDTLWRRRLLHTRLGH